MCSAGGQVLSVIHWSNVGTLRVIDCTTLVVRSQRSRCKVRIYLIAIVRNLRLDKSSDNLFDRVNIN